MRFWIPTTYQEPAARKDFFMAAINTRIITLTDTFNNQMPSGIIQARSTVTDPDFEKLIDSDLCEVLRNLNKI